MQNSLKFKLKKVVKLALLFGLLGLYTPSKVYAQQIFEHSHDGFKFTWDQTTDQAIVENMGKGAVVWRGSMMPSFWLENDKGERLFTKAEVALVSGGDQVRFDLRFDDLATGTFELARTEWGTSVESFDLEWNSEIWRIVEMYFGAKKVPQSDMAGMPSDERPFWSGWESFGLCVPGAKEGPAQSFFRMWDFGQSSIALGNFGPSMGTPYGAAFPRPVLFFGMGSADGWVVFGPGALPDAPMTLKTQTTLSSIQYLYREDLWGGGSKKRHWENPLRISWAKNAYEGFRKYYASFESRKSKAGGNPRAIWNTWGNWKEKRYDIAPIVQFADRVQSELLVLDDPWEKTQGEGKPNMELFPGFYQEQSKARDKNIGVGIWETLAWIEDPEACGLTHDDLILDRYGNPSKVSWSFNPFAPGIYCLDLSSETARQFLIDRTQWAMRHLKPELIKLDFGYGLPNPNMGVPRDPKLRGERYTSELVKIISQTAKELDPNVKIMYYGINPMYLEHVDIISLDDQGDLWYEVKKGHDQWSIWASLLSHWPIDISGSSGYDWAQDDYIVLNSLILGTPGAVLPTTMPDGSEVPLGYLNRRLAVNKWFRKTSKWKPLWFNSEVGGLEKSMEIKCWGRLEFASGQETLTALILDESPTRKGQFPQLDFFNWKGRWALVSQDNNGILKTEKLVVIPFDPGFISIEMNTKPLKVFSVGLDRPDHPVDFRWNDGKLMIEVTLSDLEKVAGYEILRAPDVVSK
ncbi:MAG: hypothetical protein RIG77_08325 [Cyclobacteriaceae bacterium]